MSKWSLFFLVLPLFAIGAYVVGPFYGWDLPENVSTFGRDIDKLYYIILWITGIAFVGTQFFLVYILYRFRKREGGTRAWYTHGDRKVEVIWTVIPALILLYIELAQLGTWMDVRFARNKPKVDPIARVVARQFEWRIVYPGNDNKFDTPDDIHVPNELHMVKNRRTLIELRSMDVLHSFFLPHFRIKQDAVPGLSIPVWFDSFKSTTEFQAGFKESHPDWPADRALPDFELVCAELCGWGHYKMRGKVIVHETQAELNSWLANRYAEQEAAQ